MLDHSIVQYISLIATAGRQDKKSDFQAIHVPLIKIHALLKQNMLFNQTLSARLSNIIMQFSPFNRIISRSSMVKGLVKPTPWWL